jgi:hypothetical protein
MSTSQAVFIHPNPDVLNRISKESGGTAKVTPSLVEALRWIADQQEHIAGIFLCPDDSSFSAFRFLELTLNYRPAVPVYLFEESLSGKIEESKRIQNSTHIKGVFTGKESYNTLMSGISNNTNPHHSLHRKKTRPEHEILDHIAIPTSDFFNGQNFECDTYVKSENGNLRLLAEKNTPIHQKIHELVQLNPDFLYIRTTALTDRQFTLHDTYLKMLENKDFPDSWKMAEVMAKSHELLQKMRTSGINNPLMQVARTLISDLQRLILNINTEDRALYQLINRAWVNDRTIYCATLSILVCQQLKFEKKTTLEILGIASILQDVSLYRTPFGDLSDRDPKSFNEGEAKYHHRHPVLSADILAHDTDIPQVTLQVIRQHHERKDRTGYPLRTGGAQLHPMAEILSLINGCYDCSKKNPEIKNHLKMWEIEVFPHYSEIAVEAFRKIHSRL